MTENIIFGKEFVCKDGFKTQNGFEINDEL